MMNTMWGFYFYTVLALMSNARIYIYMQLIFCHEMELIELLKKSEMSDLPIFTDLSILFSRGLSNEVLKY